MQNFSDKIRKRKEHDQVLLNRSVQEISDAAKNKKGSHSDKNSEDDTVREVNFILDCFQLSRVEVTHDIQEEEAKVLYIMSSTNILRRKITLKDKWWTESALPLLCNTYKDKLMALIPVIGGGYLYYKEDTGKQSKLTKEQAKEIQSIAYCFYKPFESKPITKIQFIKSLVQAFTLGDIIYLVMISFIIGLLGLVLPIINQIIFNKIIPSGTISDIWGIASLLFGVSIMSVLFTAARTAWMFRIGNKIDLYAQNAIWVRIFNLPVQFFKSYEAGELTQRAAAVNQICTTLSSGLIPAILGSVFSFLYLFQIQKLSEQLLLPSLIIILIILGAAVLSNYIRARYTNECNAVENRLSSLVFQLLNGVTKIKIAGAEIKAFSQWADLYSKKKQTPNLFVQTFPAINKFIVFGGTIVLYLIAYQSDMPSSSYIAFNMAYGSFNIAILKLSDITAQMAALNPALDLLEPILQAKPENKGDGKWVKSLNGNIEINQLTFQYKEDLPTVINNLTLTINKGDYIGLVGSSGCGKSTLLRLLLGFEEPQSGAIYYDDQNLLGLDTRSVRQRIGIVLQNGKLFSGNIFSNIVICAPWLSKDDAWKAAKRAGLAEDIEAMPMGLYTMIAEGGAGLSGGQQQRLLIARALAANPDIVMFDEATSALDNMTQTIVVRTLEQLDITRIVIAHRLSTIRNCTKIIYMQEGRIAEEGTYEELLAKGGLFAESAKRQLI